MRTVIVVASNTNSILNQAQSMTGRIAYSLILIRYLFSKFTMNSLHSNTRTTLQMESEEYLGQRKYFRTELSTRVNGMTLAKEMDVEFKFGLMEQFMKAIGSKIKHMEEVD